MDDKTVKKEDYDDSEFNENKIITTEDRKIAKELSKDNKIADPFPKMKMRCGGEKGYKKGGLVKSGKPKIAKKGWK